MDDLSAILSTLALSHTWLCFRGLTLNSICSHVDVESRVWRISSGTDPMTSLTDRGLEVLPNCSFYFILAGLAFIHYTKHVKLKG